MVEERGVRRYLPEEPFPPYAYVPRAGLPHPTSNPAGHHFGRRPDPVPAFDPESWRECRPYLYGFDLLNHQFFWEAHEAWEPLWHACGRKGVVADFLKALIKLAAAGVKDREGVPAGTRTHARRAADLWRGVARSLGAETETLLGLRIPELIDLADRVAQHGWPERPIVLLPDFSS